MLGLSIIGSTGSIGTQALDVIRYLPGRFQVLALAAGHNLNELAAQITEFRPELVAVASAELAEELTVRLAGCDHRPEVAWGDAGLDAVAGHPQARAVLTSVVGTLGLGPTLTAIRQGKRILLANKETLVAAGELVMTAAAAHGAEIIPVDSEHSALFQCLIGQQREAVHRLILTASGGPFLGLSAAELARVKPAAALRHPRWQMGRKVTVDSATMMNKGLELIEAGHLFGVPVSQIDVVIHPESIVHSMVEFNDGSLMAQLGVTDMRLPIQYALCYPERLPGPVSRLDLPALGRLNFAQPDEATFPSLLYARQAATMGGTTPAVLNAANEVAVARFLAGEIPFDGIFRTVAAALEAHVTAPAPDLATVLAADGWARQFAAAQRP